MISEDLNENSLAKEVFLTGIVSKENVEQLNTKRLDALEKYYLECSSSDTKCSEPPSERKLYHFGDKIHGSQDVELRISHPNTPDAEDCIFEIGYPLYLIINKQYKRLNKLLCTPDSQFAIAVGFGNSFYGEMEITCHIFYESKSTAEEDEKLEDTANEKESCYDASAKICRTLECVLTLTDLIIHQACLDDTDTDLKASVSLLMHNRAKLNVKVENNFTFNLSTYLMKYDSCAGKMEYIKEFLSKLKVHGEETKNPQFLTSEVIQSYFDSLVEFEQAKCLDNLIDNSHHPL